jgi:hypothetical protein
MQPIWFAHRTKYRHRGVTRGTPMTIVESIASIRAACLGLPQTDSPGEVGRSGSLADILLAIEQKRGALYMRQMSGVLIEKWNLHSDSIANQSSDTLALVARLLKL